MDVSALLEAACLLVPGAVATENDITVDDVWEHLAHDEWEHALNLLEELGDSGELPLAFWTRLAVAAEQAHLPRSAAWCHWRCAEIRNGVVRADLTLHPAARARRRTPIPGAGVLRPMWDVGLRAPEGGAALAVGALWLEELPHLAAGGRATVRIVPLTPALWTDVRAGQRIALHEFRDASGTAVVLEVREPRHGPSDHEGGDEQNRIKETILDLGTPPRKGGDGTTSM
ncbi:hypothetical protein ACH4E8_07770 [Streptomyces sp. NPDC017979]|uniref:hypothetical protein n=1 Tax=Streptomyces sp. NPDC017979 TaxID=3365024 RepID=UPI0037B63FB6